jgi:hypothetical protein
MINTVVDNGKTYADISELHEWDKNLDLRAVGPDAYRRLKAQIQDMGEYKPVIITEDGTVLGGNTRLKAFRELGFTRLWVSIVPIRDNNDLLKYNLSDNDNVGLYSTDGLANILSEFELNVEDYAVDFEEPTVLSDLPGEGAEEPKENKPPYEVTCPECGAKFTPTKGGESNV